MNSWDGRWISLIKLLSILITWAILISGCKKNHRPLTPQFLGGPEIGRVDYAYNFSIEAIDPDDDSVAARCIWGDGDTSDWSPFGISGNAILLSHLWSDTGTYYIKAQIRDKKDLFSNWSEPCSLKIIIDEPPLTPTMPSGLDSGKINVSCDFASSTIDPDGNRISIRFAWGNGDTSDWSPYYSSGDTVTTSYTWINTGTYLVKAQAKDELDMTSDWSEGLPVRIDAIGTLKWRYHTSDYREIFSSPAIGLDGTIYFGAMNDTLYALNSNGTLKWAYSTGRDIYSSPAIGSDGTIYFGSYDFYFYALKPDGSLKWRYDAGTSIHSSPAIGPDGTIYFGQMVGEYSPGYFNALNPDGTLRWRVPNYNGSSPPVIGLDSTVYFVGSNSYGSYLCAFSPDGMVKWLYPIGSTNSSPAIGSDGTIYFDDYALNPDGTLKWRGQVPISSPVIGPDGTIYGAGEDRFYAINPDGTVKWYYMNQSGTSASTNPLIGSDGTIYFGGGIGAWSCGIIALRPDGTIKWVCPTGPPRYSSPAISFDGTIYIGTEDGYFYAVQSTGRLADTPWPKFRHDSKNTGRFGGS
jgi:outer membrane protein assembly factor BamB